jgi:hypothetical protein
MPREGPETPKQSKGTPPNPQVVNTREQSWVPGYRPTSNEIPLRQTNTTRGVVRDLREAALGNKTQEHGSETKAAEMQQEAGEWLRNREAVERRFVEANTKLLQHRIENVRTLAAEIRHQLERSGSPEMDELRNITGLVDDTCDYWQVELSALVEKRDPQAALAMSWSLEAQIHGLEAFIDHYSDIASSENQEEPVPEEKVMWLRRASRFLNGLLSIKHELWALIGGLLNPEQWTLSGEVNVPFLARAGIQITFGPSPNPTKTDSAVPDQQASLPDVDRQPLE